MVSNVKKISVGILGATGLVGQKLVALLNDHPYFKIGLLVASERSSGYQYGDLVPESKRFNYHASSIVVQNLTGNFKESLLFSCLDASLATQWELELSKKHWVISNASSFRLLSNVPLLIPEVNGRQLDRYEGVHLVTNPNCVVAILSIVLAPIIDGLGIDTLQLTTMQSLSGAGYPGVSALDIQGNILPYIAGEEEKIVTELRKIFGDLSPNLIQVQCFRVAVSLGHLLNIFFTTKVACTRDQLIKQLVEFKDRKGKVLINYSEDALFPQPLKHLSDMEVSVGNLKGEDRCWQMTVLGNNLVRGAAGAALANAEYLYELGKL